MKKMLGVMIDCSRNAVMKPEKVKEFAGIIAKMGYNTLMLYTEDTYEIDSHPYFGHLRGRYTKSELVEIDEYCSSIGIEVIPCIQTLAHLNQMFNWRVEYSEINDCDDILLIGEEETYALIEEMIKTMSECFKSGKIHLGMDEAWSVGRGKYADKHGICDKFEIMNEHLHRVCRIAEKYGYKPMIWDDMFRNFAQRQLSESDKFSEEEIRNISKIAELPKNIEIMYWDYYSSDTENYDKKIAVNKIYDRNLSFAGGAWTWGGFAPYNLLSMERTDAALSACKKHGINDVIMTIWGDDGGECSPFAVLPTLLYTAEKISGNDDMESIRKKFVDITGVNFDSFMLLDGFDTPGNKHKDYNGVTKYLLYNDPFMGINDCFCSESDNEYYKTLAGKIRKVEGGVFKNLFESYVKFAEVLSLKSALGIKTRKAYLKKNDAALEAVIEEYDDVLFRLKEFHRAYREIWSENNKPHGFDIQDMRLGGLMQRITSCKERLEMFIKGEIESIPELEEEVLESKTNNNPWCSDNLWSNCVSANSLGHRLAFK